MDCDERLDCNLPGAVNYRKWWRSPASSPSYVKQNL